MNDFNSARRTAQKYLAEVARTICRDLSAGDEINGQIVELDIAKCRLYANAGLIWARERPRIQKELETLGIDENKWCKRKLGRAITTLQGYRQVGREWGRYVSARREAGENGLTGMDFAKSLVPMNKARTISSNPGDHCDKLDISRCTFVTDDALSALKKMKSRSMDVIPNSPPYFPLKWVYGGQFDGRAVGWESTVEEYLDHLVTIYREAKRVLERRGTLVVVIGDSYSTRHGARFLLNSNTRRRPDPQKQTMPDGMPT